MIRFLIKILRDERGFLQGLLPLLAKAAPAALTIGSSLLGSRDRKEEQPYQQIEPYPGYRKMMGGITGEVSRRIGQPGELYTGGFDIPQPGIEAQTERILGQKLGALPSAAEYKGQVEASKTQQIAREKERAAEQQSEEQQMYNRLGLVSSTPWMARAGELGEESLGRQADIESGMDIYGLEYGLKADELAEQIANQYLTQGQVLGQAQRGYEQFPIEKTYEDWVRAQGEPLQWATLGMGGRMAPDYYVPEQEEGWGGTLGTMGQDIGSSLLKEQLMKMLKLG